MGHRLGLGGRSGGVAHEENLLGVVEYHTNLWHWVASKIKFNCPVSSHWSLTAKIQMGISVP